MILVFLNFWFAKFNFTFDHQLFQNFYFLINLCKLNFLTHISNASLNETVSYDNLYFYIRSEL